MKMRFVLTLAISISIIGFTVAAASDRIVSPSVQAKSPARVGPLPRYVKTHELVTLDPVVLRAGRNVTDRLFEFEALGKTFEIRINDVEARDSVDHWIGEIVGEPNSRVRLTLSKGLRGFGLVEAPSQEQLVALSGKFVLEDRVIRIRPVGRNMQHLIYEVDKDKSNSPALRLPRSDDREARWVEALGIQRDLLEDYDREAREYYIGRNDTVTNLRGPKYAGKVFTKHDLAEFLEFYGVLVPLIGSEDFEFLYKDSALMSTTFWLHQRINGILVKDRLLSIEVDNNTGEVIEVFGVLSPDFGNSVETVVTEFEAENIALKFLGSDDHSIIEDRGLTYVATGGSTDWRAQFHLEWYVETDDTIVMIDATSGKVYEIESTPLPHAVCEKNPAATADVHKCPEVPQANPSQDDATTIKDNGACQTTQAECDSSTVNDTLDMISDAETMYTDLLGEAVQLGRPNGNGVDVILEANIQDSDFDSKMSVNKKRFLFFAIRHESDFDATDNDGIVHEGGHAIHAEMARGEFYWDGEDAQGNATATQRIQNMSNALREAIGDISGVIQENYPSFSQPIDWVLGPHDLSQDRTMEDFLGSSLHEFPGHENSRIISHMFYRLVTNSNGVGMRKSSELFAKSLEQLKDRDGDQGLSFEEYRDALIIAAEGNTTYEGAIREAFNEIGIVSVNAGSSGGGTGGTTNTCSPSMSAPTNVTVELLSSCTSTLWTKYRLSWSTVSGADEYEIWYDSGAGFFVYAGSDPASPTLVFTRIDTGVKVRAIKTGQGCASLLSSSTANVTYLCQ